MFMKKVMVFIICVLYGTLCSSQNSFKTKEDKMYPYLDDIMRGYYHDYYDYPTSIEELITYSKYSLGFYPEPYKQIIESFIIPTLTDNKSTIRIAKGEDFVIYSGVDTLLYISPFSMFLSPCDIQIFIGKDPKEYANFIRTFINPIFFSQQGEAILLREKLIEDFKLQFSELQQNYLKPELNCIYNSYDYDGEKVPTHLFLEYNVDKGLYNYCTKKEISIKSEFYKALKNMLDIFCRKYNCSRIVFVCPDYV